MRDESNLKDNLSNDDRITLDIVKELWTKTYNTAGKPDWSRARPMHAGMTT